MKTEKPLSERIIFEGNCKALWLEDVAEAVERLKEELLKWNDNPPYYFLRKIDEIFGDLK